MAAAAAGLAQGDTVDVWSPLESGQRRPQHGRQTKLYTLNYQQNIYM